MTHRSPPWLIALGAGRWQTPGIQAARAAGLRVLAVDAQASAPGLAMADRALVLDTRDTDGIARAVESMDLRPAGAIAFCHEAGVITAAALRERFGLPGVRGEVAAAMVRKDLQRARWTAAGLPCPRWRVATRPEEAEAALRELAGTCILKPVDSAGSRGVTVLEPDAPWRAAYDAAHALSGCGRVIIEDFIIGLEHTVETFSNAGRTAVLAITSKRKVPGTSNTVASELATTDYAPELLAEISEVVVRALAALDFRDGPGHTEILRTAAGELFLVESAGRGGGFMVADGIVPAASGFPLSAACALQAAGLTPPWPDSRPGRAVVLRFVPSRAGRVVSIEGFAPEDEIPHVRSEAMVAIGQELGRAACDGDRMAYILADAANLPAALALADARERRIKIRMEAAS